MLINETAYNKLIANNLRRLANEHGVTQSDIAKKLDVSKVTDCTRFCSSHVRDTSARKMAQP